MDFSRIKMARSPMGWRGVLAMTDVPSPSSSLNCRMMERSSYLAQQIIHYPFLIQAREYLKIHKVFHPIALINKSVEEGPTELIELKNDEEIKRFQEKALNQDMISIIYLGKELRTDFFSPEAKGGNQFLMMDTHGYNTPSHGMVWSYRVNGDEIKFNPYPIRRPIHYSIIWQPIAWEVLEFSSNIQPVWMAAIEIEGDTNITLAVCENLDGEPEIKIVFRTPWSTERAEVHRISLPTAEEGIERLKKIYNKALDSASHEGVGKLIFNYEKTWELDENPFEIKNQIRRADFWETYSTNR